MRDFVKNLDEEKNSLGGGTGLGWRKNTIIWKPKLSRTDPNGAELKPAQGEY